MIFFIANTPNSVPIQESESTVKKAQERVARLHARVANQRLDAIHKATTMIARTYSTVCIEDLNARGGDTSRADTPCRATQTPVKREPSSPYRCEIWSWS